eukprot:TRINITY_DN21256_c0_g1_i1.p1 TRINITY_DN21256_c0_g1~~TRINITY_DN21256_c0_g1_i1.p1  ORF type:complete len:303 (+),score=61.64 TRINITY_DN21256_c0_g1_i1:50-958(+)
MGIFHRDPVDNLFSLTSDEYLDKFNVRSYLNDVVHQLLECRDDRPLEFMSEYFLAVSRGTHITHRSFSYIMSTQYNRCSFALLTRAAFDESAFTGPMAFADFSQLVLLMCSDFPNDVLMDVFSIVSPTTASLRTLLEAVGIRVYFYEFFKELKQFLSDESATLTKRSVTVDMMCISSSKDEHAVAPTSNDAESPQSSDFDAFHGRQNTTANPSREVLCAAINLAAERFVPSPASRDEAELTAEHLLLELYTSQQLYNEIFSSHPSLNALVDKSVDDISASIHQAHEAIMTTSRKKKMKNRSS